jgi:hypothetical protein
MEHYQALTEGYCGGCGSIVPAGNWHTCGPIPTKPWTFATISPERRRRVIHKYENILYIGNREALNPSRIGYVNRLWKAAERFEDYICGER